MPVPAAVCLFVLLPPPDYRASVTLLRHYLAAPHAFHAGASARDGIFDGDGGGDESQAAELSLKEIRLLNMMPSRSPALMLDDGPISAIL